MTTAVSGQILLCWIAFMASTVQFSPAHTLIPPPGCSLYETGGFTHVTCGRWSCCTAETKSSDDTTFFHSEPYRMDLIACGAL